MQNTEIFSQNTESFFMGCTGLDIVKVSTVLNPVLVADDTSLFHAHTDFDTLIEEINEESTYKFERQNFRTGCRIAPKFGTHVPIYTLTLIG